MKIIIPNNIYSHIIAVVLEKKENVEISYKESSLISKALEEDTTAIGLIPSMDLINHKTFFVSSKAGISFDGLLSNSYFYLSESNERNLGKVFIRGDVSLNEIILTKILFKERFFAEVEINLDTHKEIDKEQNVLVVGDENIFSWEYGKGISFSDQIAEVLDLPYINFIFASQDNELIEHFEEIVPKIDETIEENLNDIMVNLRYDEAVKQHIQKNIGTVYFEITSNEVEAIQELFRLVYYHRVIDDMFDVKFL